jgi:hypothetical protein
VHCPSSTIQGSTGAARNCQYSLLDGSCGTLWQWHHLVGFVHALITPVSTPSVAILTPLPCPPPAPPQHLGDFPYRLAQNNHLVYEYTPLPPLTYPELATEMYCHRWGAGRGHVRMVPLRLMGVGMMLLA